MKHSAPPEIRNFNSLSAEAPMQTVLVSTLSWMQTSDWKCLLMQVRLFRCGDARRGLIPFFNK